MQLGHVFTLANRSMKKPVLAAASVALSLTVLLGSAPAVAEQTVVHLVFHDQFLSDNSVYFYDNEIGSIVFDKKNGYRDMGMGGYMFTLTTSINPDSPYASPYFHESYVYEEEIPGAFTMPYRDVYYSYSSDTLGSSGSIVGNWYTGETLSLSTVNEFNNGDWRSEGFYAVNGGDVFYYSITNLEREDSIASFGYDELRSQIMSTLPVSGYGIFDFNNSFVYYQGGSRESLAQIIAGDGALNFGVVFDFQEGNLSLSWGRRTGYYPESIVLGISLAYNLAAIPEPETWAMLLAGLGIVGAVSRRRRIKECG